MNKLDLEFNAGDVIYADDFNEIVEEINDQHDAILDAVDLQKVKIGTLTERNNSNPTDGSIWITETSQRRDSIKCIGFDLDFDSAWEYLHTPIENSNESKYPDHISIADLDFKPLDQHIDFENMGISIPNSFTDSEGLLYVNTIINLMSLEFDNDEETPNYLLPFKIWSNSHFPATLNSWADYIDLINSFKQVESSSNEAILLKLIYGSFLYLFYLIFHIIHSKKILICDFAYATPFAIDETGTVYSSVLFGKLPSYDREENISEEEQTNLFYNIFVNEYTEVPGIVDLESLFARIIGDVTNDEIEEAISDNVSSANENPENFVSNYVSRDYYGYYYNISPQIYQYINDDWITITQNYSGTTSQRLQTYPSDGSKWFDTTLNKEFYFNNGVWSKLSSVKKFNSHASISTSQTFDGVVYGFSLYSHSEEVYDKLDLDSYLTLINLEVGSNNFVPGHYFKNGDNYLCLKYDYPGIIPVGGTDSSYDNVAYSVIEVITSSSSSIFYCTFVDVNGNYKTFTYENH